MLLWYDNIGLCFTDNNSLLYEIQTDDIFADTREVDRIVNYAKGEDGYFLHSSKNKKIIGKF